MVDVRTQPSPHLVSTTHEFVDSYEDTMQFGKPDAFQHYTVSTTAELLMMSMLMGYLSHMRVLPTSTSGSMLMELILDMSKIMHAV